MVQAVRMREEPLIVSYMDRSGKIAIGQVADGFGMSKGQLAETAGLARETLYRTARSPNGKNPGPFAGNA